MGSSAVLMVEAFILWGLSYKPETLHPKSWTTTTTSTTATTSTATTPKSMASL